MHMVKQVSKFLEIAIFSFLDHNYFGEEINQVSYYRSEFYWPVFHLSPFSVVHVLPFHQFLTTFPGDPFHKWLQTIIINYFASIKIGQNYPLTL